MIEEVRRQVCKLMNRDDSGHGFDHAERVWKIAVELAKEESADTETVELAALLHDVDDYKLVGQEQAEKLTNAKRIMKVCGVEEKRSAAVCDIISHMGYSKLLSGIRPKTTEGKIVSDADMLDAIGVNGIIRCLSFAFARCQSHGTPVFDKDVWPELGLSAQEYKKANRHEDNFINHFFEKLLRLHNLMLTNGGKRMAESRQQNMVLFLKGFFRENYAPEWEDFLDNYLANEEKV